jgi:glycosyltransferase involved in cell wall biosynthesis
MMMDFPYVHADHIVLYSPYLITEFHLEPFREKILFAHEHFINLDRFMTNTSLQNRPPIIGFIGRISEEKGVNNFVRALCDIHAVCRDVQFFIGGDGPQIDEVKSLIIGENLGGLVELSGWIAHDDIPAYLNRIKLLVVPSYTEGLPNIVLEAMACGTPVLATPVGGIPDIIEDAKTGFLMENNSPECITKNVVRALGSPDLERIADTALDFVQNNYSFDQTFKQWKSIIHNFR